MMMTVVTLFLTAVVFYQLGNQRYLEKTITGKVNALETDVTVNLQGFRDSIHDARKELTTETHGMRESVDTTVRQFADIKTRLLDLEQTILAIKGRYK